MPASPAPFDLACALLREGRLADAEQLMVRELQAAERRHGRGSPEWASAQCDLGNILLGGDQAKRLPQDLLARLEVTIANKKFNLNVELRREPTEEELDQLNRVVEGATAEFRQRLTSARYAS